MPFPWKKNRVTRISQIVADLQSPKHGGSLVVETGFPTSLIDLFVKNRSRFKKSKSKKPASDLHLPAPSPATPPPPLPQEASDLTDSVVARAEPPTCAEAPSLMRSVGENVRGDDDGVVAGSSRVGECGFGSDANTVLAAFLKMFVAVVLTLSVKKLTVGITVSAFALLFLEYAGKLASVKSLTRRVSTCVWFQKLQFKVKKNCEAPLAVQGEIVITELVRVAELSSNPLSIEEIEVVETKSEVGICCEETNFAGPALDSHSLNGDKKWGCPQVEEDSKGKVLEPSEISECKTKGSRSGKFKSRMVMKLVPKKFRGSKKEKREKRSKESEAESGSEVSSTVEEDKAPSFEIEEERAEGFGKEKEENYRNRSLLLSKMKLDCIRDDEVDDGITGPKESPLARKEVAVTNEKRVDRVGNSGYIILLIIALAGLVFGRFPSLILTMTWCFMLKIAKTRGRS